MKVLIVTLLLTSCSAVHHYNKAIKKGMKIDNSKDTIQVSRIDSIPYYIAGTDSIIYIPKIEYKDTVINISNVTFPKTRKEVKLEKTKVKQDAKTERKLINIIGEIKQDSIKQTSKTERVKTRHETKSKNSWWKFWLGLILGIIITLIFTLRIKK
jgi:Txe/YoeB family toxin of Txe-Axe toxin-antitoxin module